MKLPACFKIMLFLVLACSGCKVKETTDPDLAYEYWAGIKPPKRIKVINGRYLQSSHLSRAFTLYLEVQATPDWREKFIQQNKLKKGMAPALPGDAPSWFRPPSGYAVWKVSGFDQGSRYYIDSISNHMYIFETQL